jgi:hypothetical protein
MTFNEKVMAEIKPLGEGVVITADTVVDILMKQDQYINSKPQTIKNYVCKAFLYAQNEGLGRYTRGRDPHPTRFVRRQRTPAVPLREIFDSVQAPPLPAPPLPAPPERYPEPDMTFNWTPASPKPVMGKTTIEVEGKILGRLELRLDMSDMERKLVQQLVSAHF